MGNYERDQPHGEGDSEIAQAINYIVDVEVAWAINYIVDVVQ